VLLLPLSSGLPTVIAQIVHSDAYRLRILNACNTRTLQLKFGR